MTHCKRLNHSEDSLNDESPAHNSSSLSSRLPKLSQEWVSPLNILHTRGIYARVKVGEQVSHWRFQHIQKINRHWIKLSAADSHLWLSLDLDNWSEKVNDRAWIDFSEEYRDLAFTLAHADFLDHLEEFTGLCWKITEVCSTHPCPTSHHELGVAVEHNEQLTKGSIRLCATTLRLITQRPVWERAPLAQQKHITALTTMLSLEIPALPIEFAELQTFEEGDILIAGPQQLTNDPVLLVHSTSRQTIGKITQDNIHLPLEKAKKTVNIRRVNIVSLTNISPNKETINMSKEDDQPSDKINTGDLPVELRIQVGQLSMTMNELNDIEPGHTLTIPPSCTEKNAHLLANGQTIGEGEIVLVGDQLGFRITQLG